MKPQPRKKGETFTSDRVSPAELYVRSLEGEFYLLSEAAAAVGIGEQTLRRLVKSPKKRINAPSFVGSVGQMKLYIFSREDVEEIRDYYQSRYEGFETSSDGDTRQRGRPRNREKTV